MKTDSQFVKQRHQFDEQRRSPRRSAYKKGSIFHPLQTERSDCIVRDISEDGALIDFLHPMDLPKIFWLRLEGEPDAYRPPLYDLAASHPYVLAAALFSGKSQ